MSRASTSSPEHNRASLGRIGESRSRRTPPLLAVQGILVESCIVSFSQRHLLSLAVIRRHGTTPRAAKPAVLLFPLLGETFTAKAQHRGSRMRHQQRSTPRSTPGRSPTIAPARLRRHLVLPVSALVGFRQQLHLLKCCSVTIQLMLTPSRCPACGGPAAAGAPVSPLKRHGFAALRKGGKLTPWGFSLDPAASNDIDIRVTHVGLCHSDHHMVKDDWCGTAADLWRRYCSPR